MQPRFCVLQYKCGDVCRRGVRTRKEAGDIMFLMLWQAGSENHTYDLTVVANCSGIEDYEAFAEEVIQKYEENSFYTTRLSMDFGGKAEEVCFHVYLKREEIGKKEELFQIRYRDGDIILDGIDGKR